MLLCATPPKAHTSLQSKDYSCFQSDGKYTLRPEPNSYISEQKHNQTTYGGDRKPSGKAETRFSEPPPTPPPCCCFVLGQNPGFCCLFFQMVQFLFLSAWAWLNPIAVNGKCVLISMTGAANLPAANKSHLPSHRYLRTHPPTHTYTQSSRIPEDMPPLKLEIALQRDANAVQK